MFREAAREPGDPPRQVRRLFFEEGVGGVRRQRDAPGQAGLIRSCSIGRRMPMESGWVCRGQSLACLRTARARCRFGGAKVTVLALKVFLAPSFVVVASAVARRFGTRLGGAVGGLPVIAAVVLLVFEIEHGAPFAHAAATATTLGVVALIAFVIAYARVSRSFDWPVALAAAWVAYGSTILVLHEVAVGPVVALVLACMSCGVALLILPHAPSENDGYQAPRWDLPLRAFSTLALVLAVTTSAAFFGPGFGGLLATFPVITSVLAAFTHFLRGADDATALLRGFSLAFIAYALYCFTIAVTVERMSPAESFAIAALIAAGASLLALTLDSRWAPRERS